MAVRLEIDSRHIDSEVKSIFLMNEFEIDNHDKDGERLFFIAKK